MSIHLYAEHLVNIRTLSIQASLSTVSNKETHVTLSADGSNLSLRHEGDVATIKLPINVPGGHNAATLTIPAAPTKDLSFRVSLSEKPGSGLLTTGSQEDSNVVPWTATSLTSHSEIACQACHSVIIARGDIKVWKDLPSENWAEMMDFWHCHRPDVPDSDGHDHIAPNKGYAANSRLAIESGVGMVDPVDFVFAASNCQNITVGTDFLSSLHSFSPPTGNKNRPLQAIRSSPREATGYKCPRLKRGGRKSELAFMVGLAECLPSSCGFFYCRVYESMDLTRFQLDTSNLHRTCLGYMELWRHMLLILLLYQTVESPKSMNSDLSLQCNFCNTLLGHIHTSSEGYKLRKSHLSVSSNANSPIISYPADKWLACHLLSSVESQGVRKFLIESTESDEVAIKAWIFTPDTTISSSAAENPDTMRAVKVLWITCVAPPKEAGALNRQALSEGELELPPNEMSQLQKALEQSAALLPQNARKFQSWNVGLLPRFTLSDIGSENYPSRPLVLLPEVPDLRDKEILSQLVT